ncbi:uncharacterized protein apol isoform X2 [Hypomesus transpacificus]|nr:uncharacterized protein apol isoform X2 [Hypomesus transpacificus]XP_046894394.1 uncharacterized protein apol isoform X2 [Hypomesus transpacificus]
MIREELTEVLCQYRSDTLSHIATLRDFCDRHSKWSLHRETELQMMTDIKERTDRIDLTFKHVRESPNKWKALGEYLKSGLTQVTAEKRREELEKELGEVLKDTLAGLEELDHFLDAVERLAVTSVSVFDDECQQFGDQEVSPAGVRDVITASQEACPLLVRFRRNARDFFLPSLFNVQVLAIQLDSYIRSTQQLCDKLESILMTASQTESEPSQWMFWRKKKEENVDLGALDDTSVLNMLVHLKYLSDVRTNPDFRLVFLFQEEAENFMELFIQSKPRMLQFLTDLEGSAVQLDNMKRGAQISTVAGSSVGAVGGVLSIVGLALILVTAGVSLALTMAGVGMGVTSGVNSVVTTVTETAVNATQQKKANELFQSFMEDVQNLQGCLEDVAKNMVPVVSEVDATAGAGKILGKGYAIGKGIDSLIDCASGMKLLRSEDAIADLGQAAKGTPLALSKAARGGFIALNALFIGLDVFFICKDSVGLANGSKSEVSQLIRARARLWSSELESWQKIHDSLQRGLLTSQDSQNLLEMPFYPLEEMTKGKKTFWQKFNLFPSFSKS